MKHMDKQILNKKKERLVKKKKRKMKNKKYLLNIYLFQNNNFLPIYEKRIKFDEN